MFEPIEVVSGGVQLIAVVFGLVEFIKDMAGLQGKQVTALAAALGFLVLALFEAQALFPEAYAMYFNMAARSLVFGLTAAGYYKFVNKRVPQREAADEQRVG
jgi:hypothetical protein